MNKNKKNKICKKHFDLGIEAFKSGDFENALENFQKVYKIDDSYKRASVQLIVGNLYYLQKDFEKAIEHWSNIHQVDNKDSSSKKITANKIVINMIEGVSFHERTNTSVKVCFKLINTERISYQIIDNVRGIDSFQQYIDKMMLKLLDSLINKDDIFPKTILYIVEDTDMNIDFCYNNATIHLSGHMIETTYIKPSKN